MCNHCEESSVEKKVCTKCGIEKELSEFYFNESKGTYTSSCKECTKKDAREYRARLRPQKLIPKEGFRFCKKCGLEKSLEAFYLRSDGNGQRLHICKSCYQSNKKAKRIRKRPILKANKEGYKICNKCFKELSLSEFRTTKYKYKDKVKLRYEAGCKECQNNKVNERYRDQHPLRRITENETGVVNICVVCCNPKDESMFFRKKGSKRDSVCKKCRQEGKKINKIIIKENEKYCPKCHTWKSLDKFQKTKSSANGYSSHCKCCQKKYRDENKEKIKEYSDRYRRENSDKIKRQTKKRYWTNREQELEANRIYRIENKEYIKQKQKERLPKHNKWVREKYANDINFRLSNKISGCIWSSLRNNGKQNKKNGRHWEDLVVYKLEELRKYLESKWTDGMSWENYSKEGWHIDHIRPISSFNITSYDCEDFKKCWSLNNLRPMWATTRIINGIEYLGNLNKGKKIIKEITRKVAYEVKSDD